MKERNATSLSALDFVERFPRMSLPPKYRQTSFTIPSDAMVRAVIRLYLPSLRSSQRGIWAPVNTTGLSSPSSMNDRAEAVYDGQKITVYSSDTEGYSQDDTGGGVPAEKEITGGKVNINTADSVTLQTIPGIGPSKAARIIEYRESQGRFKKIDDIKNVTGIGDMTFENIKDYITV